ncbi:AAA family ATPase [Deinococcus ruber]|uniref:AAA domain-containing protein n=1 Tax=Deinococcus ruber TaxID=1848197 RepID=A0A918FFA9_9DEIO|nr:AAA family ATPase [Deinococcus ruber]GGR34568.1 hypothetical protein GCM10008957_50830 [Deinococcus ruber]
MAIKTFKVGNFKSIGKEQYLEFSKYNLIFGPNSAGKTSIMQALILLNSVINRADPDVMEPKWGIELGGFQNYVHLHKIESLVSLSATFEVTNRNRLNGQSRLIGISVKLGQIGIDSLGYSYNNVELLNIKHTETKTRAGGDYKVDSINFESIIFRTTFTSYVNLLKEILPKYSEEQIIEILGDLVKYTLEANEIDPNEIIISATNSPSTSTGFSANGLAPWEVQVETKPRASLRRVYFNRIFKYGNFFKSSIMPDGRAFYEKIESLDSDRLTLLRRASTSQRQIAQIIDNDDALLDEIYLYSEVIDLGMEFSDFIVSSLVFLHRHCIIETRNSSHIGPVRWHPSRRLYESELRRSNSPEIRNWLSLFTGGSRISQLNSILSSLDLNYEIQVKNVFLENNKYSDEGIYYDRVLELNDKKSKINVAYRDVGTGLSQVVPVLVGLLSYHRILSMEQPELHLHPALQSKLADIILSPRGTTSDRQTIFIETHSEHIILRFQRRVREGFLSNEEDNVDSKDIKVFFALPTENGLQILDLEIGDDGEFIDPWPGGFFEERLGEIL